MVENILGRFRITLPMALSEDEVKLENAHELVTRQIRRLLYEVAKGKIKKIEKFPEVEITVGGKTYIVTDCGAAREVMSLEKVTPPIP